MSIIQLDKIDIISTTPEGEVVLHITDHLDWGLEKDHIHLLQDKVNAYLGFIESGQIFEVYPNSVNNKIAIEIVFKYEPPESSFIYLEQFQEIVTNLGIPFSWRKE